MKSIQNPFTRHSAAFPFGRRLSSFVSLAALGLFLLATLSGVQAQTYVYAPGNAATTEGNSNATLPFGAGSAYFYGNFPTANVEEIYNSSLFTAGQVKGGSTTPKGKKNK